MGKRFEALDNLNVDAIAAQLCSTRSLGLRTLASDGVVGIGTPRTSDAKAWRP